ncbi:SDR family NAD(P)-dependent oxidoreductase [Conexibacter sp. JD483]|uniref:SDR family NAD(P)-dependent oxidoreductase n=1 Tax=unclassified Conexibacter TaxID=2627773 RepID=UPI002724F4E6|nr:MULTISPECIES: SDR family NAD(P)-dependent oxidoreductase [unclassified Conexibacter]MDO8186029.1 SDR family NAD(P)-dependent oxidoreductase [Conexibacter sp. CPCC 205706]MDO8199519.1 SDR family NAD(P)-dependent oxidoreductase [Conexibacter sp. CPCC 205762]MDR9368946.1 SDR family NAD(P)-dependent oxidoreductase [Conexibacter sp. JD483]
MTSVLITGSADGLGHEAARQLLADGHDVVLHGRSPARAREALAALPRARGTVAGDLSTLAGMRAVAEQANALGRFDAVLHNAGVYLGPRAATADGLERVFAVNVLAPYVLTALIERPQRLVYMTSGMHESGVLRLDDAQWQQREWNATQAYCDSKLHDVLLAFAVARRWPQVRANAVDPGWVRTKMGGAGAPDGVEEGSATQAWLAAAPEAAQETAGYWHHLERRQPRAETADPAVQEELLALCAQLSGVTLPD